MGPRIREDKGGDGNGFPPPIFTGQALCGNDGGMGRRVSARDACPRYGRRGWVPASARTREGVGMDSRPHLHGTGSVRERRGEVWNGG